MQTTGRLAYDGEARHAQEHLAQEHLADPLPSRGSHRHWLRPLASRLILQ
jgi:hypothetical protein